MKKTILVIASLSALMFSGLSMANTTAINPVSDGSLYVCNGCNTVSDGAYVLASGYIQGDIKFDSLDIKGSVSEAILTLNPYGLPLWGDKVAIYGFGSDVRGLDASDANDGTFLGTLHLPVALGYGQDAFFDVTNFIKDNHSPFIGFNLRTEGTDVFSSLEYNYGHPAQLLVRSTSPVPEPETYAMMLAGLGLVGFAARRKNKV